LASYAADGHARTGDRSSRLRAHRGDRRSGALRATGERTRPTLSGRLGASRLEPGDARRTSRPLKSAFSSGRARARPSLEISRTTRANRRLTRWSPAVYHSRNADMLDNAAHELARRGRGSGRDGGDNARAPIRQSLDSSYDDVEILGKLVTCGDDGKPSASPLHVQNGAVLGAAYARLRPSLPGPAVLRVLLAGVIEHVATWPMTGAGRPLPPCPQGATEARRQPPSLRPSDDPPRSVRHGPRTP
jgi:hypothetical protein